MAYTNGYAYRRKITVNSNRVSGGANLTNFPMLVSLSGNDYRSVANGGKIFSGSGFDIRLETLAGVKLDHEIDTYNSATGELVIWVRIPTLTFSVGNELYIYYGNPLKTTTEENISGVWGSDYNLVSHLNNLSGTTVKDSTGVGDGAKSGVTLLEQSGIIGKSQFFDGIDNRIEFPTRNGYANGFTWQTWHKVANTEFATTSYDLGNQGGGATGDYWNGFRRGRAGIDTPGASLVDFIVPNTQFGSQVISIQGYQANTSVVAGTFEVYDNSTGVLLGSGNLLPRGISDGDKRLNSPFQLSNPGHDFRIVVYFSGNTDLFVDFVSYIPTGYNTIFTKAGRVELSFTNNLHRLYLNNGSRVNTTAVNGQWQHVVVTHDNSVSRLYVDGILRGTSNYAVPVSDSTGQMFLGFGSLNQFYYWGNIDEFRTATVVRSEGWIATEFNNQSSPSTFYTLGPEENTTSDNFLAFF